MKSAPESTVAAVVSHPIHHFAPLYRAVTDRNLDLRVLFLSRAGLEPYHDRDFGTQVQWNSNITDGYRHEFVSDLALRPDWEQPNACRQAAGHVWSALDRLRPECVLIYGYRHTFNLAALAWCRRRGARALMTSDSELLGRRSTQARLAKRLALPSLLRAVDGFLTVGDNNEAYLAAYGVPRARMFRVPLTTDEAALREAVDQRDVHRKAVRAELGIDPAALVALFSGKLINRKRPFDLVDALRALARRSRGPRDREVVVVMAGDGQLRPALEEAAAELDGVLRLVGFADQRQLTRLYAASDLYVHPAQQDPHPLAVKEAVLSGLPVVVSDRVGSVGPTDDVRPGRNGRVYPVGDVIALAKILDELRHGPDLLAEMAGESEKAIGDIDLAASVEGFLRAVSAVRTPHRRGAR